MGYAKQQEIMELFYFHQPIHVHVPL